MSKRRSHLQQIGPQADAWTSFLSWAWDRSAALWAAFGAVIVGGAGRFSAWLQQLGALGVVLIALAAFTALYTLLIGARWVNAQSRMQEARASFEERAASASAANPLLDRFQQVRLNLASLYHPFFEWYRDKTFIDCEIVGPGTMMFSGTPKFDNVHFKECDFVVVQPGAKSMASVALESPRFTRTKFFRVTIQMTPKDMMGLVAALGGPDNVNLISSASGFDPHST